MNKAQKKRFQRRLRELHKVYFDWYYKWYFRGVQNDRTPITKRENRLIEDVYNEGWSDAVAHEPAGGGKG